MRNAKRTHATTIAIAPLPSTTYVDSMARTSAPSQRVDSTRMAATCIGKSKWTIEAITAAAALHRELGKWPRVVEPFKKLAKANGWCKGLKLTRRSISDSVTRYMPSHERLDPKEARVTTRRDDTGALTSAPIKTTCTEQRQTKRVHSRSETKAATATTRQQRCDASMQIIHLAAVPLTPTTHDDASDSIEQQGVSLESLIHEYDRVNSAIACFSETEPTHDDASTPANSFIAPERVHVVYDDDAASPTHSKSTARARLVYQRDAVVAQIAVLLTPHRAALEQPLHHIDNAHLQRASHAKCIALAAGVDTAQTNIASLHRVLQCVLKQHDACDLATVSRLTAALAVEEQTLRQLEIARLDEFRLLVAHSESIRRLAQAIDRD